MKTGVFVFFLLAFLSEMLSVVFANLDNELSQDCNATKSQCNGYCFSILKPLLDHFVEQKHGAEDQIKKQIELITQKDEQIRNQSEQIKNNEDEITSQRNEIKSTSEELNTTKQRLSALTLTQIELITQKDEQIRNQSEQIKTNEDEITSQRNEIKSISEELNTTKQRLSTLTQAEWCPIVERGGIFKMYVRGVNVFEAPCTKDGWMIIQKRVDGVVDFNRNWEDYKNGFGDLHGEFFIGLEKLHLITQVKSYELYIELGDINGTTGYAHYDHFEIGSEKEFYYLKSIGNYSGTAGDSLSYHKRMKFSTFDRDNDMFTGNCAGDGRGGWWFNNCGHSQLNGKYFKDGKAENNNGIGWGHFHKGDYTISLTSAQMMIRPKLQKDE